MADVTAAAIRPRVTVFDVAQVARIVEQATYVLEKTGVFVENDEALALLDGAGQRVDGQRVFLTPDAVPKAVESAPFCVESGGLGHGGSPRSSGGWPAARLRRPWRSLPTPRPRLPSTARAASSWG